MHQGLDLGGWDATTGEVVAIASDRSLPTTTVSLEESTPPDLVTRDPLFADVLPSSVAKDPKGVIVQNGVKWFPIYCASCGVDGGFVPEPSKEFAFYLCDEDRNNCSAKWTHLVDFMVVPQEKFWEVARQEQMERLGREMTVTEILEALRDPNHWIWSLEKDGDKYLKQRVF